MQRIAVVAPRESLREVLVRVAEAGRVELDVADAGAAQGEAARRLVRLHRAGAGPVLSRRPLDLERLEQQGRADLLAGEAELEVLIGTAVLRGEVAAWAGWTPAGDVTSLQDRLAGAGGGAVPLPRPPAANRRPCCRPRPLAGRSPH